MTIISKPTELDAGLVFSGQKSGLTVTGFDAPSPYTPTIDPSYRFHESARDVIVWYRMEKPEPLYVFGPTGCGKSSLLRQLAARLNYPVFEVTWHDRLEVDDLIGHLTLRNGAMEFEDGPLTLAMRTGGLFILNEIDLCSPATLAGLNTILDGAPLCISANGGELVKPELSFRFAATANTSGSGDGLGVYQGAQRQNLAFLDRFLMLEVGYADSKTETDLLTSRFPALSPKVITDMVAFANEVRKLFMAEPTADSPVTQACEVTFSTRTLLRWADLTIRYEPLAMYGEVPILYALDRALGFRACPETRAMLRELAQRIFNITTKSKKDNENGKAA